MYGGTMIFDATLPPFWETARGGGPCTESIRAHERARKLTRLAQLEERHEVMLGRLIDAKAGSKPSTRQMYERKVRESVKVVDDLRNELGLEPYQEMVTR